MLDIHASKKAMRLGKLVKELQKLLDSGVSPNYIVFTEGCDCYGNVERIEVDHDTNRIDLMRGDENLC